MASWAWVIVVLLSGGAEQGTNTPQPAQALTPGSPDAAVSDAGAPLMLAHDAPFKPYEVPLGAIWIKRVAEAKSLRIGWKDTVADGELLVVTGEDLIELKSYFADVTWYWTGACLYHRDAVLVLPDETTVGLCFGCGQAEPPDEVPYYFNRTPGLVRVFFERLLGRRPVDIEPSLRGGEDRLQFQERKRQEALRKKAKP